MNSSKINNHTLKLFNTVTRKKEPFKPREKNIVKIFTCGPSIYTRPHIGNFRTFLFEDILIRYIEHLGYNIERVLNFTDIEDKAVAEAEDQDVPVSELTEKMANTFLKESDLLHLKPPTYNPRSSTTVDQAVELIKVLLKKGVAYWYQGDIFFDPKKFPRFGKLYGLDMSLWPKKKKRFKKDTYPGMRWNLGDFILWHGCTNGEKVCFDKELGSGRPSWNVQDPAMATKYLGFKIDICCGGIDNLYRHHDYNLAVVEGVSGEEFAKYWLHAEHLLVYGKKMSKSTGNIVYLEDIMRDGYTPEHVRFYLIYSHYREKLSFTQKQFKMSARLLDEFRELIAKLLDPELFPPQSKSDPETKAIIKVVIPKFEECLNNDLDIRCAFDDLFEEVGNLLRLKQEGKFTKSDYEQIKENLQEIDNVLQIIFV
jgi:cysteinyl-tRNA synthetase